MTDIKIREFRPGDRAAVVALAREVQAAEVPLFDRKKSPGEIGDWYVDHLLESGRLHGGKLLIAIHDRKPCGYAALLTTVSAVDEPEAVDYVYAYIEDLVVTASLRGTGIGSALLTRCEVTAREAGARWLRLDVLTANRDAVRLYEKRGFESLYVTLEKPLGPRDSQPVDPTMLR